MIDKSKYAIMYNKTDGWKTNMVISLNEPFLVGVPRSFNVFEEQDQIENQMAMMANEKVLAAKCKDYAIFIMPKCTLTGEKLDREAVQETLREMAEFYLNEIVLPHKSHYRKSEEARA